MTTEEQARPPREREHWALDKRVPLAVIVTIFLQTMGAIWWSSAIDTRMSGVETMLIELRSQKLDSRVTSLEDQFKALGVQMTRIEAKLDRLVERDRKETP